MSAGSIAGSKKVGAVTLGWEPGGTGAPAQAGPWATPRMLERGSSPKVRLALVRKALLVFRDRNCPTLMPIKFYRHLKM